jgi:hypothetical protein
VSFGYLKKLLQDILMKLHQGVLLAVRAASLARSKTVFVSILGVTQPDYVFSIWSSRRATDSTKDARSAHPVEPEISHGISLPVVEKMKLVLCDISFHLFREDSRLLHEA